MERVDPVDDTRRPRRPWRPSWGLLLAALATMGTVLLWQGVFRGPSHSGILEFRIAPYQEGRDTGPARWPVNSPYVLRFKFAQDAYALIFHVDSEGRPSLLYPQDQVQAFEGGRAVQVPPAGSGEAWVLDDVPGLEWFLLVGSRDTDLDVDDLLRRVDAEGDRRRPPREVAAALEDLLRAQVGAPEVLTVELVSDEGR